MLAKLNSYLKEDFPPHGYFIIGKIDFDTISRVLKNFSSDIVNISGEIEGREGIDAVRKIRKDASYLSGMNTKQVFVINAVSLTREAKSALLKTIEDPSRFTYFIFYAESREILDDTLRSRLIEIDTGSSGLHKKADNALDKLAGKFLKEDRVGRGTLISKIEDANELHYFLSALEKKVLVQEDLEFRLEALQSFSGLRSLIKKPAVPESMIRDYLIFLIPRKN